jgi:hypothetical protein
MRLVLVLVLLLSGCAKVSEMRGSDGGLRYLVGCYGALTPISVCEKKALELCPGGYTVDSSREFMGPVLETEAGPSRDPAKQLVIQCTGPVPDPIPAAGG